MFTLRQVTRAPVIFTRPVFLSRFDLIRLLD